MNKKIKFFLLLIFFLFTAQFIYAESREILGDVTIPANSNFSENSDGYGIYFTTDTIDYATVFLQGDITLNKNLKGIYCGNYGTLSFQKTTTSDITIYTSSNTKVGIQSQYVKDCYQSTTISIENININSNFDNVGLFTCGTMNISANPNDKKIINIISPSSAAIQVNAGGTFYCENMIIKGSANNFFLLTGKISSTTFKNTNIDINSEKGFLSKQDDLIYFINSSFKNENEHFLTSQEKSFPYVTGITADNSTIEGFIDNKSNKVNFVLTNNSVWKMKKSSKINELNISNSNVNLAASNDTSFNTLTVEKLKGQGTNNQITLNTQLNGDDSLTDKIVITKSIEGKFILNVNNVGGQGAKTEKGIKIVDTTIKNPVDTFKLKNSKIDIGAYVYKLQQGYADDNYSWFLRTGYSPSEKSDAFVTISNTPQFMNFVVKTGMNELAKRLGDIRRTPLKKYNGVWVRTYGKIFDYDKDLKTKLNIFGVEAGYDFRINKTNSYVTEGEQGYETVIEKTNKNRWYLGVMAGFQNINKIETEHRNSNKNGNGTGSSKSIGIYGSYIAPNGLFVDLTLRNFWMDFDMKTYSSSDEQISFKPQTTQTAFSAETGKEFLFGKNKNIVFEPKMEFLFAYNPEVNITASNNNKIKYGSNMLCNGKLGFMVGLLNKGQKIKRWLPYLETSYNYDFNNKTDISYSEEKQTADFSGGYFDLGLGLNSYLGKGVNCYGSISYQTGSDQENFTWNLGIRYGF